MTPRRPSHSKAAAARKAERQREIEHAIAAGRLVLRQMTRGDGQQNEVRPTAIATGAERRRRRGNAGRRARAPRHRT